jgi:Putative addiction module component
MDARPMYAPVQVRKIHFSGDFAPNVVMISLAMSLTKEQIKTAALQLNPTDREALAEELLLSLSDGERDAIDAAWLAEAKRRDEIFKLSGRPANSVDKVVARLKNSIRP